ncbi:MAG: glycosyltransferase family 4 protein [Ignavibacteria bacterium]|nr:glycosyltransferase family 4 protein [Ignavibacteria bacterium]
MEQINNGLRIIFWRIDYFGAFADAGISATVRGLIKELIKRGNKIYHISGGKTKLPEGVIDFFVPFNKFFRNFPEVFSFPYQLKSTRETSRIIRQLEKVDFIYKVIHDFNFSGAIIRKKFNIPLFLQVDGVNYWVKKHWGKLYFAHLLRWAQEIEWIASDRIFTFSNQLKKQLTELGVEDNKIIVNPCGFDPELFNPNIDASQLVEEFDLKNKFVIGFSGTFGYYHGITFFAESLKFIRKRIPNAVFLFVGDGDYRAQLDYIVKRDNLESQTIITGFLPYNSVPQYLSACDVLVSPCINNDDGTEFFNSPLKNFEYMGLGKPVVATAVGQQKEIFVDRYNAILVEERNPEAIAEAIFEIYKDPDLANKIGRNAHKEAIEKHTWGHRAQRILLEHSNLIKKK